MAVLACVSIDDVRDVINISSVGVPDAKVLKMIKRAEVTLEREDHPQPYYGKQKQVEARALNLETGRKEGNRISMHTQKR